MAKNEIFRPLKAEEIECRVGAVGKDCAYIVLLLYKNQRTDANILDETVGEMNWQDRYYECKGNLFCSVGIRTNGEEWIWKDNCGTESNSEAEKGEASDAFKRACFNWGIGRELYTAPFIYIEKTGKDGKDNYEIDSKGKPKGNFAVTYIKTVDGKIRGLNIENTKKRRTVFAWGDLGLD